MLKVLELFAGIGACSSALSRLGIDYEIVDAVEIDKYAIACFNAIHGTHFPPQDVSEWDKDVQADLIMHGSPCTDVSVAGLQMGAEEGSGTRSSLMYESIRIIKKVRPKYVVWENVKNLLSQKHKKNFDRYIYLLESFGYNSYYQVLNSKDFGVPQNRERIFTVSIRKDIDPHNFAFPLPFPLEKRLKDVLEEKVDERYYLSDERATKLLNSTWVQERNLLQTGEVCRTILARDYKDPTCVPTDEVPHPERILNIYGDTHGTNHAGNVWNKEKISPTLTAMEGGNRQPFIIASRGRDPENPSNRQTGANTEQRGEANVNGTSNCLTTVLKDNYVAEPAPDLIRLGNIYPSNGENGNVYATEGVSPTIKAGTGVKGNGIGSNNAPKIVEPTILKSERNEYGKAIRKQYESGEVEEKIGNMHQLVPREDGISNTLTTLLKDNLLAEPSVIECNPDPKHQQDLVQDEDGISRTICAGTHGSTPHLTKTLIKFVGGLGEKDRIGDGKDLSRNYPQGARVYDSEGIATALTAQGIGGEGGATGLYVVGSTQKNAYVGDGSISPTLTSAMGMGGGQIPMLCKESIFTESNKQMITPEGNIRRYIDSDVVDQFDPDTMADISFPKGYNKAQRVHKESPALNCTTVKDFVYKTPSYRIRKLTPLECWRLQGFSDLEYHSAALLSRELAEAYLNSEDKSEFFYMQKTSSTQLYKMAGNSITVDVLYYIFKNLLTDSKRLVRFSLESLLGGN